MGVSTDLKVVPRGRVVTLSIIDVQITIVSLTTALWNI